MKDILYRKPKKLRDELVQSVIADYEERKLKRRGYELQWKLNLDFYNGKQNSMITNFNTLIQSGKQFHWQRNESFNHIAPIVEGRLSKITNYKVNIEPIQDVMEGEVTADSVALCKNFLESTFNRLKLQDIIEQATMWSEVTGSAFYKVNWDAVAGSVVGVVKGDKEDEAITEGDICIGVCSPFEIFPDNLTATDMDEVRSLIHAKYLPQSTIKELWNVDVSSHPDENILVIERYETPTKKNQNGRLIIVAAEKLLYDGELPYINGEDGKRALPFIRQVSEGIVGSFFGKSVIERAIPVQRAYNTVKNRKVEFLNRLACGVLAVEEGSVDLESLENDGLSPGKVIVYRHGSTPPKFMDTGTLPAELEREEERLLREFESITGSGEIIRSADSGNTSGVALSILQQVSNRRLLRTIESMVRAKAQIACHVLRLFKQFATIKRIERIIGEHGTEMLTFDSNSITCCNVIVKETKQLTEYTNITNKQLDIDEDEVIR